MAEKFYAPSTGTPDISPSFAAWAISTSAIRINAVQTRIGSAQLLVEGVVGVGNQLLGQFITEACAAQTVAAGSIKGVFRQSGSNANVGALAVRIAKCNAAGETLTEILSITASATASGTIPPWNSADPTNRRLEEGIDDFNVAYPEFTLNSGDRVIFEFGHIGGHVSRRAFLHFGDDSVTDLAEDETGTVADSPWWEITSDITFGAGAPTPHRRPRMMRTMGCWM